tara:strand:+ start:874 stop:1503 length:630 start_codon:yes stop_codon:yes gene_type:complete
MKRMTKIAVTGLLGSVFSSVVFAESGWFLSAQVGAVSSDVDEGYFERKIERQGATNVEVDLDDSRTAWSIGGGYRFMDNWAFEARYLDLGNADFSFSARVADEAIVENVVSNTAPDSAEGVTLGVVGAVPLSDMFGLYARGGIYRWEGDWDIDFSTGESVNIEDGGSDFYWGLGGYVSIGERIQLTLDWERIDLPYETDLLSVGISYQF